VTSALGNTKGQAMQYTRLLRSLMSYTTYFCSTAQVSFRVPPASVTY